MPAGWWRPGSSTPGPQSRYYRYSVDISRHLGEALQVPTGEILRDLLLHVPAHRLHHSMLLHVTHVTEIVTRVVPRPSYCGIVEGHLVSHLSSTPQTHSSTRTGSQAHVHVLHPVLHHDSCYLRDNNRESSHLAAGHLRSAHVAIHCCDFFMIVLPK